MAIGRISGALLFSDLDRQGTDLAFTTNGRPLTYMDFTNFKFGVNTNSVIDTFTVTGTANVSGVTTIHGNLVLTSGIESTSSTTGALVISGGIGVAGNIYAQTLIASTITGNISNPGGSSSFDNIAVTNAGVFGSINTANAVITGGYINGLANLTAITAQFTNVSTANAVISGGYISTLTNVTATTGNTGSWYTTTLNATSANITTGRATNFSTGNAVISGGYISALTNAQITTSRITNFSTANAVISGGYISALANITVTTGNVGNWYAATLNSTTLNSTTSNITTSYAGNFSTSNAVIGGGYISALANATVTTANIGNINFVDIAVSSRTGNLILSPLLSDGNAVVIISATSALQLPAGTTAQQPTSVYSGAIRWNNGANTLEVYTGSSWVSLLSQINNQTITPDGVTDTYVLDYSTTAEGIIVSINGTLQQPGVAYTVAGTQITFAEIPLSTDIVSVRYIAAGTVTAENTQEVNSANVALTTTPIIVDSFDQSAYRSAKYMATTTAASSAEFAEFSIIQMGAIVSVSNINRALTGSTLTTFTANISGTTVRLWANTVTGTASVKLQKTYFVV